MVNKPNTNSNSRSKDQKPAGAGQQGEQTAKKSFKRVSEYGRQLQEKQKVKQMYGMREKQFRRFYQEASDMEGVPGENLLNLLERRLDNVVYRLKMAISCSQARQMVVHGHILVNGIRVTKPSYFVSIGDVVGLHASVLNKAEFLETVVDKRMNIAIKVPEWLELVKQNRTGKVLRYPTRNDVQYPVEEHMIVALYSK
ncbi:MAG: 30S ribosomal protein S4 [Candidatus Dependentiae bacterium]|nr:30S ribosomal protein S4 [Candidatus Dependentiae bacterium]